MDPKQLNPEILKIYGALPERNGCTIYAIAAAVALLEPQRSLEEVASITKELISTPIENTPLQDVATQHNLPAPLLLLDGSTTDTQWILSGQGQTLMNYLNTWFKDHRLNIRIDFKLFQELSNTEWLELCRQGKVLIPHFQTNKGFNSSGHSIAVAYFKGQLSLFDINQPIITFSEEIFRQMMSNGYLTLNYLDDGSLSINRLPILIISKI